ncbi:Gfo/Idh/MocA family oxidoreductase [Microbacterium sp.]|uniref:Gfo/Idh/MocA family oxidoreductase n=1 Tax=Microbacterium sp. TaxID=51671 RepID=UPI002733D2AC|nr:Gfo/Idh/MocA family oxidoreductase [Microbacterium sp.]MDP3951390.1 Gfo/Idh/MocA family oxidoreductase [Microbacterium sp.]
MKVGFAGLVMSHAFSDARNVQACGAQHDLIVIDEDEARIARFLDEHPSASRAEGLAELLNQRPDVVVVTVPPAQVAAVVATILDASIPVVVNKPAAASFDQLAGLDRAVAGRSEQFLTSSVLRFAPAVDEFIVDRAELLSVRVTVRHDVSWWIDSPSAWQDDRNLGGGTAVMMGVHGFELLDAIVGPGFEVSWVSASKRHLPLLQSEDVVIVGVEWRDGLAGTVEILGHSDREGYEVVLQERSGTRRLSLGQQLHDSFGYDGFAMAILSLGAGETTPVAWSRSRGVLAAVAEAHRGAAVCTQRVSVDNHDRV